MDKIDKMHYKNFNKKRTYLSSKINIQDLTWKSKDHIINLVIHSL